MSEDMTDAAVKLFNGFDGDTWAPTASPPSRTWPVADDGPFGDYLGYGVGYVGCGMGRIAPGPVGYFLGFGIHGLGNGIDLFDTVFGTDGYIVECAGIVGYVFGIGYIGDGVAFIGNVGYILGCGVRYISYCIDLVVYVFGTGGFVIKCVGIIGMISATASGASSSAPASSAASSAAASTTSATPSIASAPSAIASATASATSDRIGSVGYVLGCGILFKTAFGTGGYIVECVGIISYVLGDGIGYIGSGIGLVGIVGYILGCGICYIRYVRY